MVGSEVRVYSSTCGVIMSCSVLWGGCVFFFPDRRSGLLGNSLDSFANRYRSDALDVDGGDKDIPLWFREAALEIEDLYEMRQFQAASELVIKSHDYFRSIRNTLLMAKAEIYYSKKNFINLSYPKPFFDGIILFVELIILFTDRTDCLFRRSADKSSFGSTQCCACLSFWSE